MSVPGLGHIGPTSCVTQKLGRPGISEFAQGDILKYSEISVKTKSYGNLLGYERISCSQADISGYPIGYMDVFNWISMLPCIHATSYPQLCQLYIPLSLFHDILSYPYSDPRSIDILSYPLLYLILVCQYPSVILAYFFISKN